MRQQSPIEVYNRVFSNQLYAAIGELVGREQGWSVDSYERAVFLLRVSDCLPGLLAGHFRQAKCMQHICVGYNLSKRVQKAVRAYLVLMMCFAEGVVS